MSIQIGQQISHYKILEKIGGGGMGVIYKAEDTKLKRSVALKFLPPNMTLDEEAKERFMHEAQAASALDHNNICTIYEINETKPAPGEPGDGQMYLAMALYEGETLQNKIDNGPLPIDDALNISIQIAQGLSKAHQKDIVHRDIKPANIIITNDGVVKILDFGLAKLSGKTKLTKEGTTLGTTNYMSPEQVRGEDADNRTDIWSLGVIFYEMVTGRSPFKGEYEQAIMYSIVNEEVEPVTGLRSGVPMELERVINKVLVKETSRRYQSMDELIVDLETIRDEIKSPITRKTSTISPPVKSNRMMMYMAGAAIILVIALVVIFLFSSKSSVSIDNKSIAVLPFENMNKDEESEYFSNGITEDIITQLSKIGDLRVISRNSSMRYKNSEKSLKEIGKELNVGFILEGSIRRSKDKVRITSQLINSRSDDHVWAETYDRRMADIFDIQSEISQKIASSLKTKLTHADKQKLKYKPTNNMDAYDYYLKGREFYNQYRSEDNENAIKFFIKALVLDPEYAIAYAGLGDAYAQRFWRYGFSPSWLDSSIEVSNKALSINENSAEAHKSLGLAFEYKGWFRKAIDENLKAIELNPNYNPAIGNMGWVNYFLGNSAEALKWTERNLTLEPNSQTAYNALGWIYWSIDDYSNAQKSFKKAQDIQPDNRFALLGLSSLNQAYGNYQKALDYSHQILSIDPNNGQGFTAIGKAELHLGNFENAKEHFEKALDFFPGRSDLISLIGYILLKQEKSKQADKMFEEAYSNLLSRFKNGNEWWIYPYRISEIHAIRNDKEQACFWLQKAIDSGWRFYQHAEQNLFFEDLRNEDKFKSLIDQVKLLIEKNRKKISEMDFKKSSL